MRKWLAYGLYAMVLLPMFSVNMQLPDMNTKVLVPLEPLMALYGLLLLLYAIIAREKPTYRLLDFAIVVFLTVAGISTMFSTNFFISGKAFVVLLSYAFIFYGSHRILRLHDKERTILWNTYTIGFLALMLFSLFKFMAIGINYHNTYEMAQPFSKGHTLLIATGFPAFLRALEKGFKGVHRNLFFSYAGFFLLFIVISFSRLYWLVVPFFLFLFALYYLKRWRWWLVALAGLLIVSAAGALYYLHQKRVQEKAWQDPDDHKTVEAQIMSITNWRANDSNLERINRWKVGFLMVADAPVTGIGLGNYADEYFNYPPQVDFYDPAVAAKRGNAHNLFFGWLFEMGILGLLAGAFVLVAIFHLIYKKRHHPLAFLCVILIMNFLLLGLIEDWLLLEKIAPYWWLSVGYVTTLLSPPSQLFES